MIKANTLPQKYSVDLLFSYLLYDECLIFLYHKDLKEEVLNLIKREYVKCSEDLKISNTD